MEEIKEHVKHGVFYIKVLCKWLWIASIIGMVCGLVGAFFHHSVDLANTLRNQYPYLLFGLPLGGVIIVYLYRHFHVSGLSTNLVLESISSKKQTPIILGPIIFISTVMTHLFGGSAGREGAALQIGGSIASMLQKIIPIEKEDNNLMIMCAMAGMFSAVFATPLTAVVFSMEVISVGVFYYSALFPCFMSSIVAYFISIHFGLTSSIPSLSYIYHFDFTIACKVLFIAIGCALFSSIFCRLLKLSSKLYQRYIKNPYYRIIFGGCLIIIFTLLMNSQQYNGAGTNLIQEAFLHPMKVEAFIIKMLFTALTLGAAYKGGEIVPSLCIGALIGNIFGSFLSIDVGFASAIGMIGFFCGVVNCPIASIFLSIELFGSSGILYFFFVCSISYLLSGYSGLYSGQRILYSKTKTKYIDIKAK